MEWTFLYKGFTGMCRYDEETNSYYGRVLACNDIITFEGKILEESETEFQISVDDYLEF